MYRGDNFEMPDLDRYDRDLSYLDMDMDDDLGELHIDIDGNVREDRVRDIQEREGQTPEREDAGLERRPQPVGPAAVHQGHAGLAGRRPLPKLTAFMPSKFAGKPGQDPEEHFASYMDYLREQNIESVAEAIYRFRFTLEGRASSWYRNKNFNTFKDLRSKFIRYFLDSFSRESDAALFRSIRLKPGETLDEFYGRLRSLGRRLKYSEHVILDTFLGELPPDMQDTLSHLRRRDPDIDLVEEAQLMYHRHRGQARPVVESIHMANINSNPQVQGHNPPTQELLATLSKQISDLAADKNKPEGSVSFSVPENGFHRGRGSGRGRGRHRSPGPRNGPPSQNWGQDSRDFYPNNHGRQEAPSQRRGVPPFSRGRAQGRPQASSRDTQCYTCYGWGHISVQCPSAPSPGHPGQQPHYNRQPQYFH